MQLDLMHVLFDMFLKHIFNERFFLHIMSILNNNEDTEILCEILYQRKKIVSILFKLLYVY